MRPSFLILTGVSVLALVLLVAIFVPINSEGSSLLRVCKFDESKGSYSACYFRWDKQLSQPSIYF